MKVHPVSNKRNINVQYHPIARNPLFRAQALLGLGPNKLRRLPHVFNRVLELPFRSDADVSIFEKSDCFRFIAETDGISAGVRAHTIEIHPGVIKVVVRELGSLELALDNLEMDVWRFRLPETTRPELATAGFVGGTLIVTVPKSEVTEKSEDAGEGGCADKTGGFKGDMGGQLVLVQ